MYRHTTKHSHLFDACDVQKRCGRAVKLPFAIMTSGDTHDATVALLAANGHFGLDPSQVTRISHLS